MERIGLIWGIRAKALFQQAQDGAEGLWVTAHEQLSLVRRALQGQCHLQCWLDDDQHGGASSAQEDFEGSDDGGDPDDSGNKDGPIGGPASLH